MVKKKSGITIFGDANNVFQSVTTGRVFVDGMLEPNIQPTKSNKKVSYTMPRIHIGRPGSKTRKRHLDLLIGQAKRAKLRLISNEN